LLIPGDRTLSRFSMSLTSRDIAVFVLEAP
jgi:hypothetical protein